ncbi:hypothetical protein Gasu2_04970 [Galdieria sulphuraria]|nr:hypothetical protein Gasu2_04970 [Galdieria sulphuraria]
MNPKGTNIDGFLLEDPQDGKQRLVRNEDVSASSDQVLSTDIKPLCGGCSRSGVSVEKEVKTTVSQHKKRRRVLRVVSISCTHCRQAKQACDDFRPCRRCVRLGLQATCVDAPSSRPRRCRKPTSSFQVSNIHSIFQRKGSNSVFEPDSDQNDRQNETYFDHSCPSLEHETSCSSFNHVDFSETIQIEGGTSPGQDLEARWFQSSIAEERVSTLFIPVDCLTRGKPITSVNLDCEQVSNRTILEEASGSDTLVHWRPLYSYGSKNLLSTNSDHCSDEENYSDLIYSLSKKEGLIFVTGRIWDIMVSWDQELQHKVENVEDEQILDLAKSEVLFYFVAKSIERYVQFFSSNVQDSPYCSLFALNAAIQSLDSSSEHFAQRMVSLLPPKSPVLSNDQQDLFLESVPIATLKMSVSLDDSWHKILYVNGECCDLFGTTRQTLIELLSDPSSLHVIFVDNGWFVEPLKTLCSLRKGILKRKSTFRLRSLRNEILDCLVSTSFGTDSDWLPKYIIFYIQSFHKLGNIGTHETSKESTKCSSKEKQQTDQVYSAGTSARDSISFPMSMSRLDSVHSDSTSTCCPIDKVQASTFHNCNQFITSVFGALGVALV